MPYTQRGHAQLLDSAPAVTPWTALGSQRVPIATVTWAVMELVTVALILKKPVPSVWTNIIPSLLKMCTFTLPQVSVLSLLLFSSPIFHVSDPLKGVLAYSSAN